MEKSWWTRRTLSGKRYTPKWCVAPPVTQIDWWRRCRSNSTILHCFGPHFASAELSSEYKCLQWLNARCAIWNNFVHKQDLVNRKFIVSFSKNYRNEDTRTRTPLCRTQSGADGGSLFFVWWVLHTNKYLLNKRSPHASWFISKIQAKQWEHDEIMILVFFIHWFFNRSNYSICDFEYFR